MKIDPRLLAVARGDEPADIAFVGGSIMDVFCRDIRREDVSVVFCDGGEEGAGGAGVAGGRVGRIAGVGKLPGAHRARTVIDISGKTLAPGFIDAHMHVESTMLRPREFVRLAAPHGTTGVVLDPHEIANVLGIPGIRWLMDECEGLPLEAMFALSSCVPSSHLETAGARLEAEDLAPLFGDPRVVALAEVMNFPGVVNADPSVLRKIELGLSHRIADGHAPALAGPGLHSYVAAGITSDHECTSAAEAMEKLRLGMRIFVREGSAARNLRALLPLINDRTAGRFCFCTDDRHPGDLASEGHIDHVVRSAIRLGLDAPTAYAIGSLHAAQHYRRPDLGAVAPGFLANLLVVGDVESVGIESVYHRGVEVARAGEFIGAMKSAARAGAGAPVHLPADLSTGALRIDAVAESGGEGGGRKIRVIGMDPHQIVTRSLLLDATIVGGEAVADSARDVLKMAVIERHRGTGRIGLGFVHGFGFAHGALASTVGHDSHNLALVGDNDADMIAAAQALARAGGGQCVVRNGRVLALLPLAIAGLMSDRPAEDVIAAQQSLLDAAHTLGCPHSDPFMPLSFLCLPVIPALKLTDLGLVDVNKFDVVSLWADA